VSLLARINLILVLAFLMAMAVAGFVAHRLLQEQAKREGIETVELMLASAAAVRDYTRDEIAPLVSPLIAKHFVPQMVPAYSAKSNIERLRKDRPAFVYREATLNPTNPSDRVTEWEADIVNRFRADTSAKQITGERATPLGPTLYMARRLTVSSPACLACHSTAAAAPATMIAAYGRTNGFGWKLGETIGAQIMSVPMASALDKADGSFKVFMASLAAIFVVTALIVNVVVSRLVLRPIGRMAQAAEQISNGNLDAEGFTASGKDEIAQLARSFERMRRSLAKSVALLGG
jgi:HAMP domain-containing protein